MPFTYHATMQLAFNTGSVPFDTREAIAPVHGLGFAAVEVNLQQAEFGYGFTRTPNLTFYAELAREMTLGKLTVTDAHALFLNTAQMFSARARRDIPVAEAQITQRVMHRTMP